MDQDFKDKLFEEVKKRGLMSEQSEEIIMESDNNLSKGGEVKLYKLNSKTIKILTAGAPKIAKIGKKYINR